MPAIATATSVQSIDINPVSALKYSRDFTDERENFRQHLIAAIWLPQQLDVAMAKLDVIARPGSGGGSAKLVNEQNPISFAAFDAHDELRRTLSTIVNDIQNCRGIRAGLKDNRTASLAQFILRDDADLSINHIDWLHSSHMWELTYSRVLEAVAAALDAVDLPEYDEPDADDIQRTVDNIPDEQLDAYAPTARIVEALKEWGIKNVEAVSIRTWAKDKPLELVPVHRNVVRTRYNGFTKSTHVETMPTYRLGDVVALWKKAAKKKAAKAERDAAKAARLSKSDVATAA